MVHGRLLDIAIREFAAKGLEGASTRGIAAAAGTAMSSITYHYGGKAGLYLAAADYIASEMDDVAAEHGTEAIIFTGEPAPARKAIHAILGAMIDRMVDERSESWSLFIVREQMNPTEAFERIYAGPMGRMLETLVELTCVATSLADRQQARIVVVTLFGQVMVLRSGRATVAKLVGGDPYDPGAIDQFRRRIAANIDAILDAMTIDQRNTA